jgi:hypothetical protein
MQGLQPSDVLVSHTVPPFGLRNGAATREHRERCVGVIPQKEPYFCHLTRGSDIEKQKYGSTLGTDKTKLSTLPHTAASVSEHYCIRARKK